AVIDLLKPADPKTIAPVVAQILGDNAEWLGANAINNKTPTHADLGKLRLKKGFDARRVRMDQQRFRAGRMEIAFLVYAYAIENQSPEVAGQLRGAARGFGEMAGFISDGSPVGFISDAQFELFKRNMLVFAAAVKAGGSDPLDAPAVHSATGKLFDDFFGSDA
ncbi:MAG TPA: hypothetical protein VJX23_11590, partial [Candidatus Binataceae bacterium]|nr:hypothetical protein [Candidatus Binataceae bacterium]